MAGRYPTTQVPITPEIARRMGAIVAGIHRAAPDSQTTKLNDPPFTEQRWHDIANRIQDRVPAAAALLHENASLLAGVHDLTYHPAPPGNRKFSHGDLDHPGNVMLCGDGELAVYDWDRPADVTAEYELIGVAGGLARNPDNDVSEELLLAGIDGYFGAGGAPIPVEPWIFGLTVDNWAKWAEHHTVLHRFDEEPHKFNPPTCVRTIERAINLFRTIERKHEGWLGKIRELNETHSQA